MIAVLVVLIKNIETIYPDIGKMIEINMLL